MTTEYTTAEVARACAVGKMFLIRLVWSERLPKPRSVQIGGVKVWFWSEEDRRRAVVLTGQLRDEKKRKKEKRT